MIYLKPDNYKSILNLSYDKQTFQHLFKYTDFPSFIKEYVLNQNSPYNLRKEILEFLAEYKFCFFIIKRYESRCSEEQIIIRNLGYNLLEQGEIELADIIYKQTYLDQSEKIDHLSRNIKVILAHMDFLCYEHKDPKNRYLNDKLKSEEEINHIIDRFIPVLQYCYKNGGYLQSLYSIDENELSFLITARLAEGKQAIEIFNTNHYGNITFCRYGPITPEQTEFLGYRVFHKNSYDDNDININNKFFYLAEEEYQRLIKSDNPEDKEQLRKLQNYKDLLAIIDINSSLYSAVYEIKASVEKLLFFFIEEGTLQKSDEIFINQHNIYTEIYCKGKELEIKEYYNEVGPNMRVYDDVEECIPLNTVPLWQTLQLSHEDARDFIDLTKKRALDYISRLEQRKMSIEDSEKHRPIHSLTALETHKKIESDLKDGSSNSSCSEGKIPTPEILRKNPNNTAVDTKIYKSQKSFSNDNNIIKDDEEIGGVQAVCNIC